MIETKKGLCLPIAGAPSDEIDDGRAVTQVAVLGGDYPGMKPTMKVAEGDAVQAGTALFEDKKNPGVVFTSPVAGKINAIHRGEKRALLSVVIDVEGERSKVYESYGPQAIHRLQRDVVVKQLTMSGLWTSLRTRPYSKVPAVDAEPHAIFVTAMDSNPLGVNAGLVIGERAEEFALGLDVLAKLTEGAVHVCQEPGKRYPVGMTRKSKCMSSPGRIRRDCLAPTFISLIRSVRARACGTSAIRTSLPSASCSATAGSTPAASLPWAVPV